MRVVVLFVAVASWPLLAVFAGLAVRWVNDSLRGGMIAIVVLFSVGTMVVLVLFILRDRFSKFAFTVNLFQETAFGMWKEWVDRPICCLCQQRGKSNQVHIDTEDNSACSNCKTRYQGLHRAPGGVLA